MEINNSFVYVNILKKFATWKQLSEDKTREFSIRTDVFLSKY